MGRFVGNDKRVVYLVGDDYALKANAYEVNNAPNVSAYKHFVKTNGITYPDITESSDGESTITMKTTALEVNPALTIETWKKP